jgi:hypothetical protein
MKRKTVYQFRAYRDNNTITDSIWRTASTKRGIYRKLENLPEGYNVYGIWYYKYLVTRGKKSKVLGFNT